MEPTDTTDVVQPDPGQGDQAGGGSPWADLLELAPEESRGTFEDRFREWDSNYTRTSQEASEYRKTWEPYEQAGVSQYSPQDISAAFQLLNDPAQARTWLDQTYGPVAPQPAPELQQQEFGQFDQFGDQAQLKTLLEQQLTPLQQQVELMNQRWQQQEQQLALAEGQRVIDSQFSEIEEKQGSRLDPQTRELIETWANKYIETDPQHAIPRAWDDYQKWVGGIEKRAFESKAAEQKPAAESGGRPDVTLPQIKTLKDAEKYALEQMRAQRG